MEHNIFDSQPRAILALLVVVLLTACSMPSPGGETVPGAEEQSLAQPTPTSTLYPTYTPYPTSEPVPTAEPSATPTGVPTEAATEIAARSPTQPAPVAALATSGAVDVELERIPDTDPGPSFTIVVHATRIQGDGSYRYRITGLVRNYGTETYEGIGVKASFLDDKGGGYGPVDVYCPCRFLEPGAECPFSVDMYPRNYVAYRLHPKGQPVVYRQSASVVLSGITVSGGGAGSVLITGTAVNRNAFAVRNPIIAGALIDASGRIVSVGSTIVLEDVAPGESVPFSLRIEYEPYFTYKLYAQATQN